MIVRGKPWRGGALHAICVIPASPGIQQYQGIEPRFRQLPDHCACVVLLGYIPVSILHCLFGDNNLHPSMGLCAGMAPRSEPSEGAVSFSQCGFDAHQLHDVVDIHYARQPVVFRDCEQAAAAALQAFHY